MNIGIVCYASVGGSGIVATELGEVARRARPRRAHPQQRHAVPAGQLPARADRFTGSRRRAIRCSASRSTCCRWRARSCRCRATSSSTSCTRTTRCRTPPPPIWRGRFCARHRGRVPRVITTLHGTDITLVGSDHSYSETVAFSIDESDGVTAVSESLRRTHTASWRCTSRHHGHPELSRLRRATTACDAARASGAAVRRAARSCVIHVSNFRPVKRVTAVVEVFARVRDAVPARLLLVGDGPDLAAALDAARALGVAKTSSPSASRTGHSAAVHRGRVPAAVGAGELRAGGARGDGVRGAGRRVARRRAPRGDRPRRDRVSARPADDLEGMARERDCPADRCRTARAVRTRAGSRKRFCRDRSCRSTKRSTRNARDPHAASGRSDRAPVLWARFGSFSASNDRAAAHKAG